MPSMFHFCDSFMTIADSSTRKADPDACPPTRLARNIELSPVSGNDMLDDCKPKPGSSGIARATGIDPVEALGKPGEVLRLYPCPFVGNNKPHIFALASYLDRHRIACGTVPDPVFDQVADQLSQLAGIAWQRDFGGRARGCNDSDLVVGGVDIGHDLTGDTRQVDNIVRPFVLDRLDARQRHQIVNKLLHAARLALDDPEEPLSSRGVAACLRFEKSLDIAQNGRKRRPKFVAGVGDEIGVRARHIRLRAQVMQLDQPPAVIEYLHRKFPDA